MKTMCPPGYHHNGFVASHALGHMMHGLTVHHVPKCMSCHKNHCGDNWEGTLFSCVHIYYAHLASVRFEHSVCRESLMTNVTLNCCGFVLISFNLVFCCHCILDNF